MNFTQILHCTNTCIQYNICVKFSAVNWWGVNIAKVLLDRHDLLRTSEKNDLANQIWPQQFSRVLKKMMQNRQKSRPGETYPYRIRKK